MNNVLADILIQEFNGEKVSFGFNGEKAHVGIRVIVNGKEYFVTYERYRYKLFTRHGFELFLSMKKDHAHATYFIVTHLNSLKKG